MEYSRYFSIYKLLQFSILRSFVAELVRVNNEEFIIVILLENKLPVGNVAKLGQV